MLSRSPKSTWEENLCDLPWFHQGTETLWPYTQRKINQNAVGDVSVSKEVTQQNWRSVFRSQALTHKSRYKEHTCNFSVGLGAAQTDQNQEYCPTPKHELLAIE